MPIPSHIIPIVVLFTHKNHSKETIIHVIDKINKALLLVFIIIASCQIQVFRMDYIIGTKYFQ